MNTPDLIDSLVTVLSEILDGPAPDAAWLLNPGDPGLLRSLDNLSAEAASLRPATGGSSIASHVDHLRYGLELLNRTCRSDQSASPTNYSASWQKGVLSDSEWTALRKTFRDEANSWRTAIREPRLFTHVEPSAVFASVTHLAYHLGAIRQVNASIRGPAAQD